VNSVDVCHAHLGELDAAGRRRALSVAGGLDFASNDYLGLATSPLLRDAAIEALRGGVPIGSGGSRLLRGNHACHQALEEEAARIFGSEAALFTGSGFAANSLIFSTLPQRGDLIVYDELVHASAHEGFRLSRAEASAFAHNDIAGARRVIAQWRAHGGRGNVWIAFETLYSMDGDFAPVDALAELAQAEGAVLVADEAHAIGVYGPSGRGLAAHLHARGDTIVLATCGKALGCEGALILLPAIMRDFLVNRGRNFIFSTAPSPLVAAIAHAALDLAIRADDRRDALRRLKEHAMRRFGAIGLESGTSHIIPIVIGEDAQTMRIAGKLQANGLDVRGIRPPSVPQGTARLRISLTLNVDRPDIDLLADTLKELL
jgi:8-amino-7-oxononanoate synthase